MLQSGMMGFNLDMNQLLEYSRNLSKSSDEFENFLKGFLIEMANRIIAKTKPRTPVDTGALRSAWGIETEKTKVVKSTNNQGGRMLKTIRTGDIKYNGKEISLILSNPMEYATEIEYGHRIVRNGAEVGWYEGRFMLKISIDEVRKQMPLRYKMNFENWCERNGIA